MGFILKRGDDAVMSVPMFTRASLVSVTTSSDVASDVDATRTGLSGHPMSSVKAIISGHAHYDHLMDAPTAMDLAAGATLFTNVTGKHLMAGVATDPAPECAVDAGPVGTLSRERVVAVDDGAASTVDYRNCPELRPAGAPLEGRWTVLPGGRVRLMPLCSTHPDQFLFFHLGEGTVDEDQCVLPGRANDWREGSTVAFLVDFLAEDGSPEFRVYYQDAPANAPLGHVPAELLAQKGVDVLLSCVGNYDQVERHPEDIIAALQPRYVLSGHWEDFFAEDDGTPDPYPFLDLEGYVSRAQAVTTGMPDAPLIVDGLPLSARHVLVQPGTVFHVNRL